MNRVTYPKLKMCQVSSVCLLFSRSTRNTDKPIARKLDMLLILREIGIQWHCGLATAQEALQVAAPATTLSRWGGHLLPELEVALRNSSKHSEASIR